MTEDKEQPQNESHDSEMMKLNYHFNLMFQKNS